MTLVTAVGYTVSYFMTAGPQVTPAIAAFAVGIAGQAYGRITGNLSYVPLLSGVLLLVPGSVGVRGVLAFIGTDPTQGDPSQGFQFALSMVNIAVSITVSPSAVFSNAFLLCDVFVQRASLILISHYFFFPFPNSIVGRVLLRAGVVSFLAQEYIHELLESLYVRYFFLISLVLHGANLRCTISIYPSTPLLHPFP